LNIGILDSENITTLSSSMLSSLSRMYIFTPANQKQIRLSFPCESKPISVQFIECTGAGKNNMDHHIMTLIGYLANIKGVNKIRVISNDSDFKNIVRFWKRRNILVEQYGAFSGSPNKTVVVE